MTTTGTTERLTAAEINKNLEAMRILAANPPAKPQPPASPVPEKGKRPPLYTGPQYEYKLAHYTVVDILKTFKELGEEGWLFIGTEASGKSVFYRPKVDQ